MGHVVILSSTVWEKSDSLGQPLIPKNLLRTFRNPDTTSDTKLNKGQFLVNVKETI